MGLKIFLTGGAGYVGSHMVKKLVQQGHEVTIFDNLSTGHRDALLWGNIIVGDLLDLNLVKDSLRKIKPDCIYHFAARTLVGESVSNPSLYYQNNVVGSYHLLEARREVAPLTPLLFSSTCSVHRESLEPLHEDSVIAPINPYAKTKQIVENMIFDYEKAYGGKFAILRYFNAAGCDLEGELGERHEPESHLIPRLLRHAINPEKNPMAIFGSDYPTRDGTCVRDYIHVDDLIEAHFLSMKRILQGEPSTFFNLGTSNGSSVLEVVAAVEKATGRSLHLPVEARREGDPPQLTANSKRAQELLGWRPRYNLEQIVNSAWKWFSKNYPWKI